MEEIQTGTLLKIGQVATKSGLPIKTIRYYEEIGLLWPSVKRSPVGYRLFAESVFNRLAFIKRAQSLGLSLNEIRDILQIRDRGELPCNEVKRHLELKLQQINEQIQGLKTLKAELTDILFVWEDEPSPNRIAKTICPNIQTKQ
ncbi:MAG: heavy metal-responsive transcriptional regulator [Okeania sp. SIO2H7]|nr:heavy metal-responsive transcriptional regulator [Okeania sp. SIO2H7]